LALRCRKKTFDSDVHVEETRFLHVIEARPEITLRGFAGSVSSKGEHAARHLGEIQLALQRVDDIGRRLLREDPA
jgi:hypothetical protein